MVWNFGEHWGQYLAWISGLRNGLAGRAISGMVVNVAQL